MFSLLVVTTIVFYKRLFPKEPTHIYLICRYRLLTYSYIPYDEFKHEHKRLFQIVYDKFGVTDWTTIGFYRAVSPVTDFRALGYLALQCLEHTTAMKDLKMFKSKDILELPFGITFVNVAFTYLYELKSSNAFLAKHPFQAEETIDEDFTRYVDRTIIALEYYWLKKKPENLMAFNYIFYYFWKQYK